MHLSENEGIEGNTFVVTGGSGFVGSTLCLDLVRRGAREVPSLDLRADSPWTPRLRDKGIICISGTPVNTFEFLRPLILSLGYDFPSRKIKVSHALVLARFFFAVYTLLYPCLQLSWLPQPMLLPAEVHKVGVTHYFSILKARQELGYEPLVSPRQGMAETIAYWKEMKRKMVDGPAIYVWLFCIIGMLIMICSAVVPYPYLGPFECVRTFTIFIFQSLLVVRVVAAVSSALYILEAGYAWYLARRVDPPNAKRWFWQTLVIGFFSLRYLLKKRRLA